MSRRCSNWRASGRLSRSIWRTIGSPRTSNRPTSGVGVLVDSTPGTPMATTMLPSITIGTPPSSASHHHGEEAQVGAAWRRAALGCRRRQSPSASCSSWPYSLGAGQRRLSGRQISARGSNTACTVGALSKAGWSSRSVVQAPSNLPRKATFQRRCLLPQASARRGWHTPEKGGSARAPTARTAECPL